MRADAIRIPIGMPTTLSITATSMPCWIPVFHPATNPPITPVTTMSSTIVTLPLVVLWFILWSNVSVHRRRTLCAVRCDALFNAFIFPDFHACKSKKSENRPENRVLGLVEPIFPIFRPFFAGMFIFRGIARIFWGIFPL